MTFNSFMNINRQNIVFNKIVREKRLSAATTLA
jgi:hypothetical protein